MPSARVAWTPSTHHMLWVSISRAYRTPSESDTAVRDNVGGFPGPGGTPVLLAYLGNPHFRNEGLIAYELGYRFALSTHLSMDLSGYYNDYDHQETNEPAPPFFEATPFPPHVVQPFTFLNLMHGEAHGSELAVNWKATERWTLSPGYAFEQIHMHLDPTSQDTGSVLDAEGNSPVHSAQLRSQLNLIHGIGWDASAYFVDRLRSGEVPSYTRLDSGLSWRWTEGFVMSVVGQDLVRDRHLEFVDDTGTLRSTLIKRSAYAKFTWQF
jgi:iron complex outermembrane recepter protein